MWFSTVTLAQIQFQVNSSLALEPLNRIKVGSLNRSINECNFVVPSSRRSTLQLHKWTLFLPRPYCASIAGQTDRFHDER